MLAGGQDRCDREQVGRRQRLATNQRQPGDLEAAPVGVVPVGDECLLAVPRDRHVALLSLVDREVSQPRRPLEQGKREDVVPRVARKDHRAPGRRPGGRGGVPDSRDDRRDRRRAVGLIGVGGHHDLLALLDVWDEGLAPGDRQAEAADRVGRAHHVAPRGAPARRRGSTRPSTTAPWRSPANTNPLRFAARCGLLGRDAERLRTPPPGSAAKGEAKRAVLGLVGDRQIPPPRGGYCRTAHGATIEDPPAEGRRFAPARPAGLIGDDQPLRAGEGDVGTAVAADTDASRSTGGGEKHGTAPPVWRGLLGDAQARAGDFGPCHGRQPIPADRDRRWDEIVPILPGGNRQAGRGRGDRGQGRDRERDQASAPGPGVGGRGRAPLEPGGVAGGARRDLSFLFGG